MAVDDVATSPGRIAAEIHRQLGPVSGAIPVHDIAVALDIEEVRVGPLENFEAVLVTTAERDFGKVLLSSNSNGQRRRYSLAHELGHFLCAWHRQTHAGGFRCTSRDMAMTTVEGDDDTHRRQEREANAFAIELLAPRYLVAPFLKRLPDLDVVLAMHQRLDISRVAAARRYVSLHSNPLAVVVAKDSRVLYVERSAGFPYLAFGRGDVLPPLPAIDPGLVTSRMIDADASLWRLPNGGDRLYCQVLEQERNHALVLLLLDDREE